MKELPLPLVSESDFTRDLWFFTNEIEDEELTQRVIAWLQDVRWTAVEKTYDEGVVALDALAFLGPLHASLADNFKNRAPLMFLLIAAAIDLENEPLTCLTAGRQRNIFLDIARTSIWRRSKEEAYDYRDQIISNEASEEDCQACQDLIIEGAGLKPVDCRKVTKDIVKKIRATIKEIWPLLSEKAAPEVLLCDKFGLPSLEGEMTGQVAALVDLQKIQDPTIEISLPVLLGAAIARQHVPLNAEIAIWDICSLLKGFDARHVITHELFHAADLSEMPFTGHGEQKFLEHGWNKINEEHPDLQINSIAKSGLYLVPANLKKIMAACEKCGSTFLNLQFLNEAVVETATRDLLGISGRTSLDNPGELLTTQNFNRYDAGVIFVHKLLAGQDPSKIIWSARDLALNPNNLRALFSIIFQRLSERYRGLMFALVFNVVDLLSEEERQELNSMRRDFGPDYIGEVYDLLNTILDRSNASCNSAALVLAQINSSAGPDSPVLP
jgi:hypothetical protein